MQRLFLIILLFAVNVYSQNNLNQQIRQIINSFSELSVNNKGALFESISEALPFSIPGNLTTVQSDGLKGVISTGLFEEIEIPAIGRAAALSVQALMRGADAEAVGELSLIAFTKEIPGEVFAQSALAYSRLMTADVPVDIYRQAVSYVMYNNWTPGNISGFADGIIRAFRENVPLDKFTLAMIIRIDQGLGQLTVQQAVGEEIQYLRNLLPADVDRIRRDEIYAAMTRAIDAGLPEFVGKDFYFNAVEEGWTAEQAEKMLTALENGYLNGLTAEKLALAFIIRMEIDGDKVPVEKIIAEETAYVESLESKERRKKNLPPPLKPVQPEPAKKAEDFSLNLILMQQSVQSFVGVPYVWGGETRSGTDCSGFTKTVYYEQGIIIPRVSYQQYKVGSAVKKDNLDYGDLVFFNKRGWGKINHVGLFVGDGKFAQASCSRGVTISKLSKRYYRTRYVGAKRIIQ